MVKKYIIAIASITCFGLASEKTFAQSNEEIAKDLVEIADEILSVTNAYSDARDQYVQAATLDPNNIKANYMAGKLYLETVNRERATKYYLKVLELDPNYRFDIQYLIGRGYQYGQDFDNALVYYGQYLSKLDAEKNYRGQDMIPVKDVERRIYECKNGREFRANPAHVSIVNIGREINSEWDDFAPVLNEDETLMIFTSKRRDGNMNEDVDIDNFPFEDIFISRRVGDKWSRAENIGEIVNTPFHDSNLALSADGKQLYIYKDENNGDIYFSDLLPDSSWSDPQPLSSNINSGGFSEKSVSISPDNNTLFFASNRPGGLGGFDIYMNSKDSRGKWGKSINLGPLVNTEYDEEGPFIDYDGKTLYFSSKGRKGMGGYDIFKAEYDSVDMEWGEPDNLGFPINTPDDDVYFVSTKDGKRGYYASVREDGMGYTDIYMVNIPEPKDATDILIAKKGSLETAASSNKDMGPMAPQMIQTAPVTLLVRIEDNLSGNAMDAKVKLRTEEENLEVASRYVEKGVYAFEVKNNENTAYMLSAEKDGYMFKNFKLNIPAASAEAREVKRRIEMDPLVIGLNTVLRNIYFGFDDATFTSNSYNELNKLEKLLAENSGLQVELAGHTDKIGTRAYNIALSKKRANAVINFLVNKGIDARRLTSLGFGETKPLASNDDEKEGRALNRRVEFRIVGGR